MLTKQLFKRKLTLQTAKVTAAQAVIDEAAKTPAVESVSAINGTELKVTFNKSVDKTSAENEANYTLKNGTAAALTNTDETAFKAELQEDGRTVVIRLVTPIAKTAAANFSVTIQNVLLKGSYFDKVAHYAGTVVVADTTGAEITNVVSKTNGSTASSVTVTFSEPVASPTLKVDGVTKSAKLSADGKTATIEDLNLSASAITHY